MMPFCDLFMEHPRKCTQWSAEEAESEEIAGLFLMNITI